jgi:hypothetical protein
MSDSENVANSPSRVATLDELRRIDQALTATGGNRAMAARALGMDEKRLHNLASKNPILKPKWGTRAGEEIPPEETQALHRDPSVSVQLDKLIEQQNRLARRNEVLGFSDEQKELLSAIEEEYGTHIKGMMDLMAGGLYHTFKKTLLIYPQLEKRLRHIDENQDEYMRVATSKDGERVTKTHHEHYLEVVDRMNAVADRIMNMTNFMTKIGTAKLQAAKIARDLAKDAPDPNAEKYVGPNKNKKDFGFNQVPTTVIEAEVE